MSHGPSVIRIDEAFERRSGGGVAPRLLEVDEERIDLCRENEVVLAEAADGVGLELPFGVEVREMVLASAPLEPLWLKEDCKAQC